MFFCFFLETRKNKLHNLENVFVEWSELALTAYKIHFVKSFCVCYL